jgi:hypothetical protein
VNFPEEKQFMQRMPLYEANIRRERSYICGECFCIMLISAEHAPDLQCGVAYSNFIGELLLNITLLLVLLWVLNRYCIKT